MPAISVIMPVYNCAEYLEQCLESISAQNFSDFELICVDDGSTDSSCGILNSFAGRIPSMRVLHQQNSGAGAARNAGMRAAHGKYLLFLDGDDFFAPYFFEHLFRRAEGAQAEITVCGAWKQTEHGKTKAMKKMYRPELLPHTGGIHFLHAHTHFSFAAHVCREPFAASDIAGHLFQAFSFQPWNKLFLKQFISDQHLAFQNIHNNNDVKFVALALAHAKRIAVADERLLTYRVRSGSLQRKASRHPLCGIEAVSAVHAGLKADGLLAEYGRSFSSWATDMMCGVLDNYPENRAEILPYLRVVLADMDCLCEEGVYPEYVHKYRWLSSAVRTGCIVPRKTVSQISCWEKLFCVRNEGQNKTIRLFTRKVYEIPLRKCF